jgi:hypothetical protein
MCLNNLLMIPKVEIKGFFTAKVWHTLKNCKEQKED